MSLPSLLEDRVVFVVGAAAGLGAGVARASARESAHVAVAGRRLKRAEALAAELRALGSESLATRCDVADAGSASTAVASTIAHFGRTNAPVNGAGVTTRGTLLDTTPELFDAHITTNLRGPSFTMQSAFADMVRRGPPAASSTSSRPQGSAGGRTSVRMRRPRPGWVR